VALPRESLFSLRSVWFVRQTFPFPSSHFTREETNQVGQQPTLTKPNPNKLFTSPHIVTMTVPVPLIADFYFVDNIMQP
jgi:hypothetical protein